LSRGYVSSRSHVMLGKHFELVLGPLGHGNDSSLPVAHKRELFRGNSDMLLADAKETSNVENHGCHFSMAFEVQDLRYGFAVRAFYLCALEHVRLHLCGFEFGELMGFHDVLFGRQSMLKLGVGDETFLATRRFCETGRFDMDLFTAIFGTEHNVSPVQECARAVMIFCYGLVLLRLSGKRTFGRWSALDIVISIILGSILGRALTGSAPFIGTLAAAAVLVAMHVAVAFALARSRMLARWIEGNSVVLVRNGAIDDAARVRSKISLSDLHEALRQDGIEVEDMENRVQWLRLEPSGKISIIDRNK